MGKLLVLPTSQGRARSTYRMHMMGRRYRRERALEESLRTALSVLTQAGLADMALDVLVRWGDQRCQPAELLDQVRSLAAVAGVPVPFTEADAELYPS